MEKCLMIADIVLAARLRIFAEIYDAAGIAAFASLSCVHHCVMNIKRRFAPGFRNRPMFVMVVKTNCPVHWRRGFTLLNMHKKNTKLYAPRAVRDYRLLKKRY